MDLTKFRLLSDLHLDMAKYRIVELPEDSETILLLCGDLAEGKGGRNLIEDACKRFKAVVYVLGNHEFYNREYYALLNDWREVDIENFYFLENDTVEFGDVRILGATLWTGFQNRDWFSMNNAQKNMNDYKQIRILEDQNVDSRDIYLARKRIGRLFHPEDSAGFHEESVRFFDAELSKPWEGKTIILSHHLPTYQSIHPKFRGRGFLNDSFYTSLEWLMDRHEIDVWCHGHSHWAMDVIVNDTRVVSNARGYVSHGETPSKTGFNPLFGFEV